MEIEVNEFVRRISVITLSERLDVLSAPALQAKLEALMDDGVIHFVLDLSQTPFLDSAGMAVMVTLLKRARQAGGDVKLVSPQAEAARRILHLTKFDRVFDIAETAAAARESF